MIKEGHISQVYADQLLHCGHGTALWEPEPSHLGEVQIGDVGFIQEGTFYRLFNILHSPDDPLNVHGVPSGFEQLIIDKDFYIETKEGALQPGPIYNEQTIKAHVKAEITAYVVPCVISHSLTICQRCFSDSKCRSIVFIRLR
jgi:hypothetical protein